MSKSEKAQADTVATSPAVAAAAPKKERKAPAEPDLFSTAKTISAKLASFPLEDQLSTLRFVTGVLEAKLKAQHAAAYGKPALPWDPQPGERPGLDQSPASSVQ